MDWISVKDEAPIQQDFQSVYLDRMVIVTDGVNVDIGSFAIGGNKIGKPWAKFSDYGQIESDDITHWMPLPEPPKQ